MALQQENPSPVLATRRSQWPVDRLSVAVGLLGLVGGAGVVGEAVFGRSAWLMFGAVGGPALAVLLIGWRVQPQARRDGLIRAARVGVGAGVVGLVSYDVVRWLVVWLTGSALNPFEAFPVFGELLIGDASYGARFAAGVGYHLFNGIGFAVFFAVVISRHSVLTGVAWAFLLEFATLAIYPGWLNIGAIQEFTIMSVSGHFAYGAAIGATTKHWLARP